MCREELENTWAARAVLDLSTMPKHPSLQIPDRLWAAQLKLLEPLVVWVTVGLYDQPVRDYGLFLGRRVTPGCTGCSAAR